MLRLVCRTVCQRSVLPSLPRPFLVPSSPLLFLTICLLLLLQDEWVEGYFLPKGSVVVANIHTISRDSSVFNPTGKHDVEEFIPERFLNEEGTEEITIPDTHNQSHFTFGFGRRACAGMHIANNLLFVNVANVLWGYDVKKALDEFGKAITPSAMDFEDGGLVV